MLLSRLQGKIVFFFTDYRYQEDKFKAIGHASRFMGKAERDIATACANMINQEKEAKVVVIYFGSRIREWTREIWNQLMKELVESHDYTIAHALEELYLFAKFMNVDADPETKNDPPIGIDKWQEKLGNALTFRVEWEMEHTMTASGGAAGFRYNLSGEATVSMDQVSEDKGYFGESAGEARYDSYVEFTGHTTMPVLPEYSFITELSDIDPCMKKTITVAIDQFGADTETGFAKGQSFTWNPGLIRVGTGTAYAADKDKDTGYYTFRPKIINGSAEAVNEKLVKPYNPANTNTLTIILHHEPKDDVYMK
jgi:hypothetical protein